MFIYQMSFPFRGSNVTQVSAFDGKRAKRFRGKGDAFAMDQAVVEELVINDLAEKFLISAIAVEFSTTNDECLHVPEFCGSASPHATHDRHFMLWVIAHDVEGFSGI